MEILSGDYVSCLWLCESPDAGWTICAIKRKALDCWYVTLTWDEHTETGITKCQTPVTNIVLPHSYSEPQIIAQVEWMIDGYVNAGICRRIATIPVHSAEHQVFIDKFFEVAQTNDRIGCTFLKRDLPSLG